MSDCHTINCPTCGFKLDETFVEQKCPRCQSLIESQFICGSCHHCGESVITKEETNNKNFISKIMNIFK